jgi:hypothetical protein
VIQNDPINAKVTLPVEEPEPETHSNVPEYVIVAGMAALISFAVLMLLK